ncbi:MAG: nucleoside recognition domain-containing protein, partial [Planctomycetota bacterium]
RSIEPVIAPLGFDWKIGIGLVGAFAAREVFNSTMGIVYAVGDPGDDTSQLEESIRADTRADGSPVWTNLTAITLLVWFVLAMQCMSTTVLVAREAGGWRWALGQMLYMNGLAWIACFAVYQIGRHLV